MNLYLDDIRKEPDGYVLVKTYEECIDYISKNKIDKLSLDHDLGTIKTGYDVCKYLVENNIEIPQIYIHTSNPVGRDNMIQLLHRYFPNIQIIIKWGDL